MICGNSERLAVLQFRCNDALLPHIQPACFTRYTEEVFAGGRARTSVKSADAQRGWTLVNDKDTEEDKRIHNQVGNIRYS